MSFSYDVQISCKLKGIETKKWLILPWCLMLLWNFITYLTWNTSVTFFPPGISVFWVFTLWCSLYIELLPPNIHISSSVTSFQYLVKWHQVRMSSDIINEAFPDYSIWNNTSLPFIFCPFPTLFFFLVSFITWQIEQFYFYYLSFYNIRFNRHLVYSSHTIFIICTMNTVTY